MHFFFSSRRRHTRLQGDWSSDVCSSDLRTVKAAGGREKILPDLYIARRPPELRHFLRQRTRQAYDDFAEPRRLATELSLLPRSEERRGGKARRHRHTPDHRTQHSKEQNG